MPDAAAAKRGAGYDDRRGTAGSAARHGPADPNRHTGARAARPLASRRASGCSRFVERSGRRAGLGAAAAALPRRAPPGARRAARLRAARRRAGAGRGRGRRLVPRARTGSACSPRAACAGGAGSSRRRTSSASGRGRSRCWPPAGLVCASALGAAEGVAPEEARPEPIVLRVGDEPGARGARRAARPGRLRAGAAGRGARSVRRSRRASWTSSPRPGASRCGSSCSATRSSRCGRSRRSPSGRCTGSSEATVFPASERRARPRRADARGRRRAARRSGRPRRAAPRARPRLAGGRTSQDVAREELGVELDLGEAAPALPAAGRPATRLRGAASGGRGARPRRGRARPARLRPRAGTGSSSRSRIAARRCGRRGSSAGSTPLVLDDGDDLPDEPGLVFAVSPARRGFVLRDLDLILLPDTQVFRKRPPRTDVRVGRALQSFADLRTGDHVVHEDHGVGKLLGFETKTVAGVTRDYLFLAFKGDDRLYVPHEQIAKVSRYVGADGHAPALSKLGGKAWQTIKNRARAGAQALAGELLVLYAQRQRAEGVAFEADSELVETARGELRLRGDAGPAAGDRVRQGGPRGAAADGPARLRGRRLREDGGGRARGLRRRGERGPGAPARADDDPRAAALEHVSGALPRPARHGRDGEPLPEAGGREARAGRLHRGQGRRPHRHPPGALARRGLQEPRAS